jgi:hypothetical protein
MNQYPEPPQVRRIAKALYDATKMHGSGSFNSLVKLAEDDASAADAVEFWDSVAIAAIDLTNGARDRRQYEIEHRQRRRH